MKNTRNIIKQLGISMLAALMLLCLVWGASAEGVTEVPLKGYATLTPTLSADSNKTPLPVYVENGQSLFFSLSIDSIKSVDLVNKLKEGGTVDFTVPIDFVDKIAGSYPINFAGDSSSDKPVDNLAVDPDTNKPMFRWWIEDNLIKIRFVDTWVQEATNNTQLNKCNISFDGELAVQNKPENGKIVFNAAGQSFPLQLKTGYVLAKTAGTPYYSTDASSYLVDYTVTLTLDQNMKLSSTPDNEMYCAALTLVDSVVDSVVAGGALQGEIHGGVITAPAGSVSAAIAKSGTENTLTLSSPDGKLNKGTYTFTYKMKIDPEAAAAKLAGYTEAQKTNTVELKENGMEPKLTASATISWNDVTENQFKIDKNAFTEQGADYGGVYMYDGRYYVDYRVVVYLREEDVNFVVTEVADGFSFRTDAVTLKGMDASSTYWSNNISTAPLTVLNGENAPTVVNTISDDGKSNEITVTAPAGKKLQPGAYYLCVPADVTSAVINANGKVDPQTFTNTADLTTVDGKPTGESVTFEQTIPTYTTPRKDGGYVVDSQTGELVMHDGKPVIRWDVWVGWDFYGNTTFVDTMKGMELLIDSNYTFDIHSFADRETHKESLASLKSRTDISPYLDFEEDGTGFTFSTEGAIRNNPDGTPVKLYKLVYFTTPLDTANETGLNNHYSISHTTPGGQTFGTGPVEGDVVPDMTAQGRLYVQKAHVMEQTNSLTQWKITCANTNNVPFAGLSNLDIIDLVPQDQNQGENAVGATVHYSDEWPIKVEMTTGKGTKITLEKGTDYTIVKNHDKYDFGSNGEKGFAVDLNMEEVADLLSKDGSAFFEKIDVTCYLNNAVNKKYTYETNITIKNDGWLEYTNHGVDLTDGVNAEYTRGFARRTKGAVKYGENYDPNGTRRYYVCPPNGPIPDEMTYFTGGYGSDTGDGQKEIVWVITLSSRAFSQNSEPLQVTVTDTISDNQEFPVYPGKTLKDQFLIRNGDYIIVPDSLEHNGKSFTLTFTVPVGSWVKVNGEASAEASETLYIYYHTILTTDALQKVLDAEGKDASSLTVEYSNTASASWNGDSSGEFTATDSSVLDKVVLDKTAQFMQSAGNKVSYTIEMNPYGLDLQEDSEVIQLEDSMGAGAEVFIYLENTFKLINMDTGLQMTRSSSASASTYVLKMAEDGKSFELDVPDNTHLKLTYQVKTTQPVGTEAVSLVNNASLAGRSSQEESIQFDVSSAYQSGSFTVKENEAGIRLVKLSSENADSEKPTFLSGAVFTMTELDANGEAIETAVTHTTGDNGVNGVIEIVQELNDAIRIFVIEETKAPAGYRLGDEPWKWCYVLLPQGSSMSANEIAALKAKVQCEVTVIPAGSFAEDAITNDPCVSVSATKAWGNAEDATTAPAGATVVFTLYADGTATDDTVTLDGTADDAAPTAAGGYESEAWKATFVNLPKYKDGTSEVVVYTVAETTGYKGYTASPAEPVADGGVITNKQDTAKLTVCKNVAKKIPEHLDMAFKFTVTLDDQTINGQYGDMKFNNGVAELFLRHDERITAEGLPGGIHYTVTEDHVPGFTVEASGHEGETVQDVAVTAEFTNIFTPEPVTASFPVKKVLEVPEGLTGPERWSYTINVEAKDGAPIAGTMTGTVDQDNDTVTFGPFTYTLPGIYTYTVTETGTVDGVINDRAATSGKTVKVTVVDNKDGTLTATADSTDDKPLTFTNAYVVKYVEASFPVKKVLEVPEDLEGPATWSYTITVEAEDGVPVAETMTATVTKASPTATFGPFEYDVPGTYTYTVTETGTIDGVTNDTTASKTVTVTVVDNKDGTLTATADSTDNEPLTFTNTYGVESVEASFPVKKVLEVPEGLTGPATWSYTINVAAVNGAPEAETMTGTVNQDNDTVTFGPFEYDVPGTYTYTVTETGTIDGVTNDTTASKTVKVTVVDNKDGTLTATADSTDDKPLTFTNAYVVKCVEASFPVKKVLEVPDDLTGPATWSYTIKVEAKDGAPEAETMTGTVNQDNDTVTFGPFEYDVPGTYTYTVTESGTVAGVTNDTAGSKTVTVTVVDNKDGTLTATADSTDDEPLTFTNTYNAKPVELALQVEKRIIGRALAEGEFSFKLQDQASGETLTARNDAEGKVVFPAIKYAEAGKYTYTISETQGTLSGVTYDTHTVTAVVTVTDNGKGELAATVEYTGETTFRNTYAAANDLLLTAAKTVNGAEPREDQVFTFELLDAADNVLQTKQNEKGEIIFDALHYTLEDAGKSFLYKVREKQEEKPGYTTDSTVYTVAVWVIDNGDGTLKVTKAITSGDKLKEVITFNNTYEAKGEWTPTAAKTVNGADPREDQVYEFALIDAAGNTILAENEKSDITFAPLTYDLSDAGKTYTYTVKETTASTDLLETDGNIYTVDVTVTDNKDGTLAVKPVITKDGAEVEEITFENKLTTVLSISKKVTGVETAETFAFTVKLYNADGTEATGEYAYTGDAEGKIKSGDTIELTHGQRVTISGLLPGMSYTVTESASAAFETTVNGNAGNSIDGTLAEERNEAAFVNKFRTTMFMVKKSWQGGGGGAIELTLYANGEKLEPQPAYTRSEDVYVYSGLPMYDEQEQLIVYSAKEKYVDGFLTIYDNVAPYQDETKAIYHGGTIINKAIVKADFSVKKEWSGLTEGETAPEITLVLYCNGEATDVKTPDPDRNGWYKYYDLPGEVDGVKAVYTVKELPVEGYMTGYTLADGTSAEYADNNGTITNTKIPQTGDEAPLAMWLSLMGASAMMLMLLLKRRKA